MASVSCASREIDPRLIAPVQKRLTISLAGSTSSIGIASSFAAASDSPISSRPRSVALRAASSLTVRAYSRYFSKAALPRTAA